MAQGTALLGINKFDGKNFNQWLFQMKCALKAKGIYGIATGTEAKPTQPPAEVEEWNKKDALAMCIITSTMELSQIMLIENCNTSSEILDRLNGIYALKTETNKMMANEQFHRKTLWQSM